MLILNYIIGMIAGSYFWGCLADLEGRRFALLIALFSQGIFEAISSIIPNYWGFLVLKFFSGFSWVFTLIYISLYKNSSIWECVQEIILNSNVFYIKSTPSRNSSIKATPSEALGLVSVWKEDMFELPLNLPSISRLG